MNAEPFSFPVVAADIPAEGRDYHLVAEEEDRRRLAEALKILAVEALAAHLHVRPALGGAYSVRGTLSASVVQTDVVSLDPVTQELAEEIDVTLMRAEDVAPGRKRNGDLVDAAEADGPDLFRNGRIDLGVIVSEHLALGLDPYPRAPGVAFKGHVEDDSAGDPSPFAALAALKTRDG